MGYYECSYCDSPSPSNSCCTKAKNKFERQLERNHERAQKQKDVLNRFGFVFRTDTNDDPGSYWDKHVYLCLDVEKVVGQLEKLQEEGYLKVPSYDE